MTTIGGVDVAFEDHCPRNIPAMRKDVLSKCNGGIMRKRKLLAKQREGENRMKTIGRVEVPQEAFVAALSTDAAAPTRPRSRYPMRSARSTIVALSACAVMAGCSAPVEGAPVVHIVDVAKPSVSLPAEQALPTLDELAVTLGIGGFLGQLVKGDADMLLQGVRESEATPIECVSTAYRLQKVVYQASPVRAVASQSWAGGDPSGPSISGFFGVVKLATPDDAQAFFAASADKWRRCNGQTTVLHQPEHGADGLSRITDVVIEPRIVSAVVMNDEGQTIQRALGVASDCIVDVEITNTGDIGGGADSAVRVANLMLQKIGVS